MAIQSVALEPNVSASGIPSLLEIKRTFDHIGCSDVDPFSVAAGMAVIDAWKLAGDWPVFLFAGPAGELQLMDFGADGQETPDVPVGFHVACGIQRGSCDRRLTDCVECRNELGASSQRIADRLLAHFSERGLPA